MRCGWHFTNCYLVHVIRYVCQDIGGSDPERMAAPRVEEYIRELFHGSAVKVSLVVLNLSRVYFSSII